MSSIYLSKGYRRIADVGFPSSSLLFAKKSGLFLICVMPGALRLECDNFEEYVSATRLVRTRCPLLGFLNAYSFVTSTKTTGQMHQNMPNPMKCGVPFLPKRYQRGRNVSPIILKICCYCTSL